MQNLLIETQGTATAAPSKTCTRCHQTFPATTKHFEPAKRYAYGVSSWCRSCTNAYHRAKAAILSEETREQRREQNAAKRKARHLLTQQAVQAALQTGTAQRTCTHCKETFPATSEFFEPNKACKYGLNSQCRKCRCARKVELRTPKLKQPWRRNVPEGMKACSKCHLIKPATPEHFHRGRTGPGLTSKCRDCSNRSWRPGRPPKPGFNFCYTCKAELPASEKFFARDSASPTGFRTRCKECQSKRNRELYRIDVDAQRAKNRAYWRANREYLIALNKQWRAKNPETARRIWKEAKIKRRRYKQQSGGFYTLDEWRQLVQEHESKCFYCGNPLDFHVKAAVHADHFIPLSKGGGNGISNIRPSCQTCNLSKGDKFPWEWMPERFTPPPNN